MNKKEYLTSFLIGFLVCFALLINFIDFNKSNIVIYKSNELLFPDTFITKTDTIYVYKLERENL